MSPDPAVVRHRRALKNVADEMCGHHVLLLLDGEQGTNVKRGFLEVYWKAVDADRTDQLRRVHGIYKITDRIVLGAVDAEPMQITYVFDISRVVWIALDPKPGEDEIDSKSPFGALSPDELERLGL